MPTHMKKFLSRHLSWGLTLALGISVWLFWYRGYPHALAYHEQFQLFLLDGDYFMACVREPGGLARWTAELLVQFYNNAAMGAAVLALLFMLIHRLCMRAQGTIHPVGCVLALLPPLLLWYTMGDENVLLTYSVALVMALAACLGIRAVSNSRWALLITAVIGMPLLYWLIGPVAFLPALFMALDIGQYRRLAAACIGLLAVAMVAVSIVVSSHQMPYPPDRLWVGLTYYRVPQVLPVMFVAIPVVTLLLAAIQSFMRKPEAAAVRQSGLRQAVPALAVLAAVVVLGVLFVPRGFDAKKYELIDYDYLVRTGQWKAVISKAELQQPDLPMSVSATNLALAMENQLGDRAFQFFQRGTQGLLPSFERNFATSQLTGEIYFRLGLVNTAQRFAFETMEALPNYAKSVRVMRRLAETNIINGQYEVARKYLMLLRKTFFYSKWAGTMLALMADEKKIDEHPLYGYLRRVRLQDDILFSDKEADKICGRLFTHDPQNAVAMQYLLMWPLMNRDIPTFMQYLQVVQNRTRYNPRHVQEAVCLAFSQQKQPLPANAVGQDVSSQFMQFARAMNQGGGSKDETLLWPFRKTAWYYLYLPLPPNKK